MSALYAAFQPLPLPSKLSCRCNYMVGIAFNKFYFEDPRPYDARNIACDGCDGGCRGVALQRQSCENS